MIAELFSTRACLLTVVLGLLGCATAGNKDEAWREPSAQEVTTMRTMMAAALIKDRDYDLAIPYLRDLVRRYPRSAESHLMLGIVLREKGVLPEAEKELRLSLGLAPRNAEGHAALGILLDMQKRHSEAEKAHRKAIALAPGDARMHNNLGFSLLLQKRYADAEAAIRVAIRLDPGMRRAYNNLGFCLGLQDNNEGAMEAFRQAGSQAMGLTNLGLVEELQGHYASARRYYERALEVKPGYPPALENLRAIDPQTASSHKGEQDPEPGEVP